MTSTIRARRIPSGGRGKREGEAADERSITAEPWRAAMVVVLAVGVILRIAATVGQPAGPDAGNYASNAGQMVWWNPWRASYREPLWELFVKITTGPFGYRVGALQVVVLVVGVVGLFACVWALRCVGATGWVLVAGTAAIALSERLVDTAGLAEREPMAVLVSAIAIVLVVRAPEWLPVLAAVTLAVRWELGLALMAVCVAFTVGRVIGVRRMAGGIALAVVLVGPFIVNNAREWGDPMFHSNLHATFYANIERVGFTPSGELPMDERIDPEIAAPLYREPLRSWGDYVTDAVGVQEMIDREIEALGVLPVDALRLGFLPYAAGVVLVAGAIVGAVRRRDRVVALLAGLSVATVLGYGLTLPWFERRLISHLTVLLVALICAGWASPSTRRSARPPQGATGRSSAHRLA